MNNDVFKVILLNALPASGKSEVRNFMSNMDPIVLQKEFHIGETLQLDDFPYVHLMKCIDNELEKMGEPRLYYPGETPFYDGRDFATLIELLNEDYLDLINRHKIEVDSAAKYLFHRLERASRIVGFPYRIFGLKKELQDKLADILEGQCRKQLDEKLAQYPESFENKTIIIESARGGKVGSSFPLTNTEGYQYSLPYFCPEILQQATILYILVTPEESRRKNEARANPNDPGSNLFHGVPLSVMLNDYGCDDMVYLKNTSDLKDTVTIESANRIYHLPIGIIDNRVDLTSFLRNEKSTWTKSECDAITEAIRKATDTMYINYKK